MAYATGTAATPDQMLDAIRAFAALQGWTVDRWAADGPGMALSIHVDNLYAHFRSDPYNEVNDWSMALGICGSTGFSAGAAWDAQPGAFPYPLTCTARPDGNSLFPCTYHLFAQASPRSLSGCFVSPNQANTHFIVCDTQKVGAWTGGAFFGGDQYLSQLYGAGSIPYIGSVALRADFNGSGQWHGAQGNRTISLFSFDPVTNAFNSLTPLLPVRLAINSPIDDSTPAIVGFLPHIRLVDMEAIGNGDLLTLGPDTWQCFFPTSRFNSSAGIAYLR